MDPCRRLTSQAVAFRVTRSRVRTPSLKVVLRPRGGPRAAAQWFFVDTGCDVPFFLARPMRDWLRSEGAVSGSERLEWGSPVLCETYALEARVGGRWLPFTAYYATTPTADENLVGWSVLEHVPICLRPDVGVLLESRAGR